MNTEKTETVIGIDFGTTNTAIFELSKHAGGVKKRIFSDGQELPIPSLLAISNDEKTQFGSIAKKNIEKEDYLRTHTIISSFKSLLGTGKNISINDKQFSAKIVTASFLGAIKSYVKNKYNVDINEAVFSYPVDFPPKARQELCDAANRVNIKVTGMVNEATAAYLAVEDKLRGFSNILVMDWGGGTFDASVLSVADSRLTEKAVCGVRTGGDEIDMALAKYVHSKIIRNYEPDKRISFDEMPRQCQRNMLLFCENAKINISETDDETSLTVVDYGIYGTKTVALTPSELNELVKPIIKDKIIPAIKSVLERAHIPPAAIDKVVIAGGSSNLTLYANVVNRMFGADRILLPEQKRFVSANGAAMMPFIGGGFKLAGDIGILMSDNSVYPLLKQGRDGVGSHSKTVTFSLVEDSRDARFIVTNSERNVIYDKISIPTKGFLNENIEVSAEITPYQTALLRFHNDTMTDSLKDVRKQINKLMFYYDLNNIRQEALGQ